MLWYWVIFLSLMVFTFAEQFGNINTVRARRICLIYTLIFIFLGTIRWDQSLSDWRGYYQVFTWGRITSLSQVFTVTYWPFEPAYYLVMRLINYLTGSFTVVCFFMAVIACGIFYRAAVYLNDMVILKENIFGGGKSTIIATFFAFWATSCANIFTVRTNMATAICLMSLKYVEEKKLWKFIAMVMLACMFHFAALVFLIVYPLYHRRFHAKHIFGIVMVASIVGIVGLDRIIPLIGILGGRYAEKVASYNINRSGVNFAYYNYSTVFLTVKAMANTILILAICFYIRKYMKRDNRFNGIFNIYVIGVFIQALTIGYNLELARLAVFFINIQFFALPYIFKITKRMENKVIYFIGFSAFMAVKMLYLLGSSEGYANFTTIFSK